jgi:PKD repeat protein
MRLALACYRGEGTTRDPFRPDCDPSGDWGALDLRGDPTKVDGFCLILSNHDDQPIPGPVRDLGDEGFEDLVSRRAKDFLETRLGVTFPTARSTRIMIRELMLNLGDLPGKWRRVRENSDSFVRGIIGNVEIFKVPMVRGGAVFTESFNTADSTLLGPNLTWTEVEGDAEVFSNQWRNVSNVIRVVSRAEHDVGSVDMYAQAQLNYMSSGNWGVMARFSATDMTYYQILGNNASFEGIRLFKDVSGAETQLGASQTFATFELTPYVYRIECNGSTITGKVDGANTYSQTDTSITTGQRGGLLSFAPTAQVRFDLFEVGTIAVAPVITNVPAGLSMATGTGQGPSGKIRFGSGISSSSEIARQASVTTVSGSTISIFLNTIDITTTPLITPTISSTQTVAINLVPFDIATTLSTATPSSGQQITTQNAIFTYGSSGTFFVTHTASNAFGSGSITKQVIVAATGGGSPPVANFTVSSNPTQNSPVTFTDTSTNTPTSWLWNFGDGSTAAIANPSHTYAASGTFNVALTASNVSGSNTITKAVAVAAVGGGGAAGTSCTAATADFTVSGSLTLQQIVDNNANLAGKTIRVPAGTWNCGSYILSAVNRNFGGCQIVCDPAAILRGSSGVELYGQILGLTWCGGIFEIDGTNVVGEGVMIDSTRSDKGANGNAGGRITFDNVTIRPQPGTGSIQRNGLAIWGCDLITVRYCTIHDCASNSAFGFGGAGSGISIGHGRRLADAGQTRVLIDHNLIYNCLMIQDGPSADRNGIILDLYQSDGTVYSDRLTGPTIISNNEIHDVSGRGIQILRGGMSDSLVTITNNFVHGRFADDLGQAIGNTSSPVCGIGGYGGGQQGNILCTNNTVTPYGGHSSYEFLSFDGDGPGVLGSGNHGLPVVFENSRTNSPPSGFSS